MTSNCRLLLLLVSVTFGKYIYVEESMNWNKAQTHCRSKYTDLAPVSNENDVNLLFDDDMINNQSFFWIGLMRNATKYDEWLWSGGGKVNKTFWSPWEPNNFMEIEDRGHFWGISGWNDAPYNFSMPFFCYKVHAVRERKTWEEALDHCRKNHRDLASVASETELMLMQKELSKLRITEHVWIGLRFLGDDWLWMDGQPLEYEAWALGGKPGCPVLRGCAALQVEGTSLLINGINEVETVEDVKMWNSQRCDQKLHFLCY